MELAMPVLTKPVTPMLLLAIEDVGNPASDHCNVIVPPVAVVATTLKSISGASPKGRLLVPLRLKVNGPRVPPQVRLPEPTDGPSAVVQVAGVQVPPNVTDGVESMSAVWPVLVVTCRAGGVCACDNGANARARIPSRH
jgi:hypothetical protein